MNTIAIIPARGGSQRILRKNVKDFHGKPIIAYSIETAQKTELFDRIIVSTDDEEIARIASRYGAEVYFRPCISDGSEGTQEVVKQCLEGIGANIYDYVCCIYATAPLMHAGDLAGGYFAFENASAHSYVMSVSYPPLADAAQFYWGTASNFLNSIPLISGYTRMILIDDNRVCDINTPADWKRALRMYKELDNECLYRHGGSQAFE